MLGKRCIKFFTAQPHFSENSSTESTGTLRYIQVVSFNVSLRWNFSGKLVSVYVQGFTSLTHI